MKVYEFDDNGKVVKRFKDAWFHIATSEPEMPLNVNLGNIRRKDFDVSVEIPWRELRRELARANRRLTEDKKKRLTLR